MSYKIEALIFKAKDLKETDRIYTVYSRSLGKFKIIAKGVRKSTAKLASSLEPLTFSEIFLVEGRWMDKATGAIIVDQYINIKKDERKMIAANRAFEVIDQLVSEREPSQELFSEVVDFLDLLNKKETGVEKMSMIRWGLAWKVLVAAGIAPAMINCPKCGKKIVEKDKYSYILPLGITCDKCEQNEKGTALKVDKNTAKVLRIFQIKNIQAINKLIAPKAIEAQVEKIITLMLEDALGRKAFY